MRIFIKNTSGKPDAVLTLTLGAFVSAQAAAYLAPGAVTATAALFSACLAAYVGRRHTDKVHGAKTDPAPSKRVEPPPMSAQEREELVG